MSTVAEAPAQPRARSLSGSRMWALVRHHVLTVYGLLALGYLMLPIGVVIAFSFNNPAGKFNYTWKGFTLDNWADPFGSPAIADAIVLSLKVAAISTAVATLLGTLIAMALVRYGFRGRGLTNLLIFMPISTPEIVFGASLLTLFLNLGVQLGFWTIVLAHISFNISFVVVTVKARLVGFDRHLEEAAMDLYATPWATFRRVTLPLIAPAILAGGLLAFALSIDDFVITFFNAGTAVTFPLFVWGAARVGVPPQVNVIGTIIFVAAVGLMAGNIVWQRRREKLEARALAVTGVAVVAESVHDR
jgi:spermidine/putrescine transport system permease protein